MSVYFVNFLFREFFEDFMGNIRNENKIGALLLGFRELTVKDLINYSKEKNWCGRFLVAIKLFFTGKGIIDLNQIVGLIAVHPQREEILKIRHISTLLKVNHVANEMIPKFVGAEPLNQPNNNIEFKEKEPLQIKPLEKNLPVAREEPKENPPVVEPPKVEIQEQPPADIKLEKVQKPKRKNAEAIHTKQLMDEYYDQALTIIEEDVDKDFKEFCLNSFKTEKGPNNFPALKKNFKKQVRAIIHELNKENYSNITLQFYNIMHDPVARIKTPLCLVSQEKIQSLEEAEKNLSRYSTPRV